MNKFTGKEVRTYASDLIFAVAAGNVSSIGEEESAGRMRERWGRGLPRPRCFLAGLGQAAVLLLGTKLNCA